MDRVCYGPSLYGLTVLSAKFAMDRVCYGPRCPVAMRVIPSPRPYSFLQFCEYFQKKKIKKIKQMSEDLHNYTYRYLQILFW